MFLTNLFNLKKKCLHEKISPDLDFGYCPDCGELIRNDWFITRCSCCGVKLRTIIKNGEIKPQSQYCSNCGSQEYSVEKVDKINFIDIHYAVLQKNEVKDVERRVSTTQCWQEKNNVQPKLLVQYL